MNKRKITAFSLLLAINAGLILNIGASIKGDVNNDGELTVKDFKALRNYLSGKKELSQEDFTAADVNGDGKINLLDLISEKELFLSGDFETKVEGPTFSVESGFYSSDISVELSAGDAAIYYTTDGSQPTTSSTLYSGKIQVRDRSSEPNIYANIKDISNEECNPPAVTKGTLIKAIAVYKNGDVSDVVSNTYFSGIDIKSKYNGLPVVCMTVDPDDLFDYEKGIYVRGKVYEEWFKENGNSGARAWEIPGNYTQRGEEWERKVYVELFENDGKLAYSQNMGARITGNATRTSMQKSFKFYSREEYGQKNVKYELIPDAKKELDDVTVRDKYKRFTLRNGGNDCQYAKLRDNYIQSLVGDRAFETQSSRPAIVFINGEYWGVYCLQEDYSDSYIQNNYDIKDDNVVIVECGKEIDDGTEDDMQLYDDLLNYAASNDLSSSGNYSKISEMMDIQSFIDYYCTEIFIANQDWMNNNNNYRIWRSRTTSDQPYEDGKWRWMLYDTEYSMSLYGSMMGGTYNYDTLADALNGSKNKQNEKQMTELFNSLLKNDEFKQRFVLTFCDLMNVNLSKDNMLSVLDDFVKIYEPVMSDQVERFKAKSSGSTWGGWDGFDFGGMFPGFDPNPKKPDPQNPDNQETNLLKTFNSEIANIKTFINNRHTVVYRLLNQHLGLGGQTASVTLGVNNKSGGEIKINTVTPNLSGGEWIGTYFTDYPVTLTAVAKDGYKFDGWTGVTQSASDPTITLSVTSNINIRATFSKK